MSNLECLIRKNKIENFGKHLSKILEMNVVENNFLDIEQTDFLSKKFYDSYKRSKDKICEKYASSECQSLEKIIKSISLKFSNKMGYLIIKQTEECGLLKVSVESLLKKYREIIEFDGDSICILTDNEKEGIYIDYFEENNEIRSFWYYEFCHWEL